jgi:AraC-like DNA-binding protein
MQLASLPAYYAEIRKRFVVHYSKTDRLVAALENVNPRDAAFLRKVNKLISENIGNPLMDANFVSNALHLSRTQLFRKLKPIIRQSPGNYIKALKLQKAKDLLETTDLRINEVAFKCGFESPSHFTKAFVRHFGVKPSLFCRTKCNK